MNKNSNIISDQKGNIFFALFGAVAVVGLLGTATVSVMRGPLSTMVEVKNLTKAESEMAIASHLALLEATELANDGDCDSDGFIEPLEWADAGGAGPTGGGFLPTAISSTHYDPWGTEYGYCAWDAGGTTDAIACDLDATVGNARLDGNLDVNDETYTVIAIISAGPDQTFSTTCTGGASPSIVKTGDDIVIEYTYATATAATGGLWNIKSGDPATAEITKNLEITGSAAFTAGIDLTSSTAALQLGAASMLFPDQATLTTCNAANDGLIRINTTSSPNFLELCDDPTGWVSIGGSIWESGTGDDIYYNIGTPQVGIGKTNPAQALDVVGNFALSGNMVAGGNISNVDLTSSGNASIGGTLGVTGATTLAGLSAAATSISSTLGVTGATTLSSTLGVTGATTLSSTLGVSGATTLSSTLGVSGATTLNSTLDAKGTISNSTGSVNIGDNLIVTGTSNLQGTISNSTGNVNIGDSVDITGDLDVTGNIDGTDISASSDLNASSTINVNGDKLGPALNCTSAQKLQWTNGSGWSCVTDQQGGASGGTANLAEVLAAGDNALTLNAVNLGQVAIGNATPRAELDVNGGDFLVTGTYTGTSAVPVSGAGTRMFFHPAMSAFRAGAVTGTQWDNSNFGKYSTALGYNTKASGDWGSIALGNNTTASGSTSTAMGSNTIASAVYSTAMGSNTTASGTASTAMGVSTIASGVASTAIGRFAVAGNGVAGSGFGDGSIAMGLVNGSTFILTKPQVKGVQSLGMFMGNQNGVVLAANNTMGLFGGKMIIDPAIPATNLAASTGGEQDLELDVTGDVGAINYCDELGNDCFTAAEVSGGSGTAPGNDREIVYNSNGKLHAGPEFKFTNANRLIFASSTNVFITGGNDNMTGIDNTAIGAQSLLQNTTGKSNTALGLLSLSSNTTGDHNTANGRQSLVNNISGLSNTAVGSWSLSSNTTGDDNTAMGSWAMNYNTGSDRNSAFGARALHYFSTSNTGYTYNTAIGTRALYGVLNSTTGERNTALGGLAGDSITTGNNNILIGYNADLPLGSTSNHLNIGDVITGDMATGNIAINGTAALTTPVGTTGQRPAPGVNGMLRYNTDNGKYEAYQAGAWQDILTDASEAGIWEVVADVVRLKSNAITYASADFVFGSPQLADDGDVNHDSRMFFDKSKGAFRAGGADGTQWDDGSIGDYSFAIGKNAQATGDYNIAMGQNAQATGWAYAVAIGRGAIANSGSSLAMGALTTSSGTTSTAMGSQTTASGDYSFSIGRRAKAIGNHSFAFGLGQPASTQPQVSGISSFGIFMGDQDAIDMTTTNTMGLFGGKMVIDPATPATNLAASTGGEQDLELDVTGDIGAINYCDEAGNNCFTAADVATGVAPGNDREVIFNSGGLLSADTNFTFTSAGYLGIGTATPGHRLTVNGRIESQNGMLFNGGSGFADNLIYLNSTVAGSVDASMGMFAGGVGSAGAGDGSYFLARGNAFSALGGQRGNMYLSAGNPTAPGATEGSIHFWTGNNLPRMVINKDGNIGISTTTPQASLDISTTDAVITPRGTTAQRPASGVNGMLRYNTDNNKYEAYQASAWQDILTSDSDAGLWEVNANVVRLKSTAVTYASADFLFGSPQMADDGNTDHDSRMFFDKSKGAFRAGRVIGTNWDDANVGSSSAAFGYNTKASGSNSFAIGQWSTASGNNSFVVGDSATAIGASSIAMGQSADAIVTNSIAIGNGTYSDGLSSTAIGDNTTASGDYSIALGREVNIAATGDGSAGFGLTTTSPATDPQISGAQSMGIFMGNHSAVNFAAANTLGLFGGKMVIDPSVPATQLTARGVLDLGAATDALVLPTGTTAQEPTPVNGMIRFDSTTGKFRGVVGGAWADLSAAGGGVDAIDDLSDAIYDGSSLFLGTGAGAVDDGTTNENVGVGLNSLNSNTSGYRNTSLGTLALRVNSTGYNNTAIGFSALEQNTTGYNNTAMGMRALEANTTGIRNTAVGNLSLISNTTGGANTAIGHSTLSGNTTGTGNNVMGSYALAGNTTGNENTAIGHNALFSNDVGDYNTAHGSRALYSNVAKSKNTAIGHFSMYYADNSAVAADTFNTAIGDNALRGSGTPSANTGTNNTAIGAYTLLNNTSGSNNLTLGYLAGDLNTTGSDNILIGYNVDAPLATTSNHLNIGNTIYGDLSAGTVGVGTTTPASKVHIVTTTGLLAGLQIDRIDGSRIYDFNTEGSTDGVFNMEAMLADAGNTLRSSPTLLLRTRYWDGASSLNHEAKLKHVILSTAPDSRFDIELPSATPRISILSNGNVGIGTITPTTNLDVAGTGSILIPRGTTAQEPTPVNGMIRFDSTTGKFRGVTGDTWTDLSAAGGGGAAGNTGEIQFNSGGALGASSKFKIDDATSAITFQDSTTVPIFTLSGGTGATPRGSTINLYNRNDGFASGTRINQAASSSSDFTIKQITAGSGAETFIMHRNDSLSLGYITNVFDPYLTSADTIIWSKGNTDASKALVVVDNTTAPLLTVLAGGSVGIGTIAPASELDVAGTGSILIPRGTTAQEPTPVNGMIRYDSTTGKFRGVAGGSWADLSAAGGGAGAINDLSDAIYDGSSIFLGSGAGAADDGGNRNVAVGKDTLAANISGNYNTAIGYNTLAASTSGSYNTATGVSALYNNTGNYNTATGDSALASNTSGSSNVAVGSGALSSNTTALQNTAIGSAALKFNITGSGNTANGQKALENNTIGSLNTAMGRASLAGNKTKSKNTAIGHYAMVYADDSLVSASTYNTALGYEALRGSLTAANNTGIQNTALGAGTLVTNTSGSNNVAIGFLAGNLNTTGSDNILIGYNVDAPLATTSNYLNIGDVIIGDMTIGDITIAGTAALTVPRGTTAQEPTPVNGMIRYDSTTGKFRGVAGGSWADLSAAGGGSNGLWTAGVANDIYYNSGVTPKVGIGKTLPAQALDVVGNIQMTGILIDKSDRRLKTDIKPLKTGDNSVIDRLMKINGYSFRMKDDETRQLEFGVIAQEVERVFPELVVIEDNEMQTMSVNYIGLIAPLIEATKELKAENDALKAALSTKDDRLAIIEARMQRFENDMNGIKVHTGYNINKASAGIIMLLILMMFSGGLVVFTRKNRLK